MNSDAEFCVPTLHSIALASMNRILALFQCILYGIVLANHTQSVC